MAVNFMDILTTIIYLALFIILMVFIFSIGMLRRYIPKKEVLLILVVAFLIGSIGGAFFLDPIYDELPSVVTIIEKNMPNNEETLYLDLSSSTDMNDLRNNLSGTPGFKSFKEDYILIPLWSFNDQEMEYYNSIVGNIDPNYESFTVNQSGTINITLKDNYSANEAIKSFADWYKAVYGGTLSYAQIHAVLVIDSTSLDTFEQNLLARGIVASQIEGDIQNSIDSANATMLSNVEVTLISGVIGVVVAVIGIYIDSVVPAFRRFKKFTREKRRR